MRIGYNLPQEPSAYLNQIVIPVYIPNLEDYF
jgi:hypothetical protein